MLLNGSAVLLQLLAVEATTIQQGLSIRTGLAIISSFITLSFLQFLTVEADFSQILEIEAVIEKTASVLPCTTHKASIIPLHTDLLSKRMLLNGSAVLLPLLAVEATSLQQGPSIKAGL